MTILESLREKKEMWRKTILSTPEINDLVNQYDLTLENSLLKLKNRAVQISDLKSRIKELQEDLIKSDEAMKQIVNYAINTPLDKRLSLPHELFVTIDKALGRYKQKS